MASPARNECGEGKDRRSSSLTSPTCRVSSYCATGICFDVVESQSRLRLMCCLETVVEMRSAGEVVMRRVRRDEQTTLGRMKIRRDVCDEEFLERAWVVSLARKWSRQRCRVTSRADVSETFPVRQYGELRRALKRCVVLYRRSGTNRDDHVDCGCVDVRMCLLCADLLRHATSLGGVADDRAEVGHSETAATRMTYRLHNNVLVRREVM